MRKIVRKQGNLPWSRGRVDFWYLVDILLIIMWIKDNGYVVVAVVQSLGHVQLFVTPWVYSMPGLPVPHSLPEFAQVMSIESVMPFFHLILCRPLLLLPSFFPSITVFSNELAVLIRWPKYWSLSFSISPSNDNDYKTALIFLDPKIILEKQRNDSGWRSKCRHFQHIIRIQHDRIKKIMEYVSVERTCGKIKPTSV